MVGTSAWNIQNYVELMNEPYRLGSYGGEDSPLDISRVRPKIFAIFFQLTPEQGMYAGEVGTPRLLKLFKKFNIKTTWFIPGEYLYLLPQLHHVMFC
jgi:peptidoglycan/xylan/chitin deacetylase (PgdA/CDA1 family)